MSDATKSASPAFGAEFVAAHVEPGSSVVGIERLAGGVSARVSRVDLESGAGRRSVVVRQYGDADLRANPHIARMEMSVLRAVAAAGIPAPQALQVVDDPTQPGAPYLVTSLLEGAPTVELDVMPEAGQLLAEILTQIHAVDVRKARIRGLPSAVAKVRVMMLEPDPRDPNPLDPAKDDLTLPWTTVNKSVLLHGDFWHGNVLWQHGQISGVVDWEDACLGDPLKDVSNCRAELYIAGQESTMHRFTEAYLALRRVDAGSLSFWDAWHASTVLERLPEWGLEEQALKDAQARAARFQMWAMQEYPTTSP
ncbi:MAG: phosphotransferase [Thermomicrobiales bacterium]|nr:phosphotransferase [Thermomicrobiales bacterium]